MQGTAYYRSKMLSINVKEKAFSELKIFTTIWKSKIAIGAWQVEENVNWRNGGQIELFPSEQEDDGDEESVMGRLFYKAEKVIKHDNYDYFYYRLETKISWKNFSYRDSLSLSLIVDQIVFN